MAVAPATTAVEAPATRHSSTSTTTSLPGGGETVFGNKQFLTAFYGTAGTSSLGVLGENTPDDAFKRITRMGKPFIQQGEKQLPVYELIVTVADGAATPGTDGDFSHDILHSNVQAYIDAAHRNGALLLLDIQPGRTDFLTVAKRWQWALEDPWVGLALDPEWRASATEFPGQTIGSVSAKEINRTAGWLSNLTQAGGLPEKLFVLHQFQTGMIPDIGKVRAAGRARDGPARRRFREPGEQAGDVQQCGPTEEVHDGLQDLPRRRRAEDDAARGPSTARRALRLFPVAAERRPRSELEELAVRAGDAESPDRGSRP